VCNLLGLARATGEQAAVRTALRLVDQVHAVLGRHRADDARTGWISGRADADGREHPTSGGLRIGKDLPERGPREPFDDRLEWERDGQYFHYLTRWMHALACVARAGQPRALDQAIELAQAAHRAFVYALPDGRRRMYWKMSIDLARPLVPTMGHHDALDGLLACMELRVAATGLPAPRDLGALDAAIADLRAIAAGADWTTDDPLGIGGLLTGAHALAQWIARGRADDGALLGRLLQCAAAGLDLLQRRSPLRLPPAQRLAFRELGLAIGLRAAARLPDLRLPAAAAGARLLRHVPLADAIEACWIEPAHRAVPSWTGHRDIDDVMLATALLPDGYLQA
jgi:hypothetical protein